MFAACDGATWCSVQYYEYGKQLGATRPVGYFVIIK